MRRQLSVFAPGDARLTTEAAPIPSAGQAVIDVAVCGVCGSDLTWIRNGVKRANGEPWPLGHEIAGVVSATGDGVELAVGQRVLVNPLGDFPNVIGCSGSEGGFTEQLLVRNATPGVGLLPLPDGMPLQRAALAEPLAVALHGVNRADPQPGEKVAVFGVGPIGLGAVLWLARRGITDIVAIDLSPSRLERARALGATHTIDASREDVAARLGELHGAGQHMFWQTVGTDVFIEMSGGRAVIQQVIDIAKHRARMTVVAVHPEPQAIAFETMLMKELRIETAMGYPTELRDVLDMLDTMTDDEIAPYVSHAYAFDDIHDALATARLPESAKVIVTF